MQHRLCNSNRLIYSNLYINDNFNFYHSFDKQNTFGTTMNVFTRFSYCVDHSYDGF